MNRTCEFSRDFSAKVNTPTDGPFWAHVPTCPDCQALLHAYQEFSIPADGAQLPFDLDEADKELAARLDPVFRRPSQQTASHWWDRKEFWYSTAAVLMVGAGLFIGQDFRNAPEPGFRGNSGIVRGEESTAKQYFCVWEEGSLQVTWPEMSEADQIKIMLFDGEMTELKILAAPMAGSLQIPDSPLLKKTVYGQIIYFAKGDVLQRGPIFSIPPVR